MKFAATVSAIVASAVLLASSVVEAHVTTNPSAATPGSYFQTNFRVPHGCEGNTTDYVRVEIPKGVSSVKPRALYPWKTEIEMVALETPITTPTGTINSTVGFVTWSGGLIPDNMYEDFGLQMKLPQMTGNLYWSVYQRCINGGWQNWTGVPDAAGKTSGFPAAVIAIANATTNNAGGSSGGDKASAAHGVFQTLNLGHLALAGASALLMAIL
ncbi:hypothetical protein BGW38_000915 [Lunasporangiospora selenospora]|uniref:YncI copper-binding domain-containing protein n=1 Tax=Lunasporangiospora selenospora TaxID=979761 RepID=A0A9P6FUF6_9FUNG|nr:hypothetical protein BGW38_000915 [Lunasporangiospora selenospora]